MGWLAAVPTEELIAVAQRLKYSADQPRVPAGGPGGGEFAGGGVAPGNPRDALIDGMGLSGWPDKVLPNGYWYHGTKPENLASIREKGFVPQKWRFEGGALEEMPWQEGTFFSHPRDVHPETEYGGLLLRVPMDQVPIPVWPGGDRPAENYFVGSGDRIIDKPISPDKIEYWGADKAWHGITASKITKYSATEARDETGKWTSGGGDGGLYIGVPAGALAPGTEMTYGGGIPYNFDEKYPGITLRGNAVITADDPRIPATVYHVTTNLPAVQESGRLLAGGKGGLGGDQNDRIVSMTLDHGIAQQIADGIKINAAAWQSKDPLAVFSAQADQEGWGARWRKSWPFNDDGSPSTTALGYDAGDWSNAFFREREHATGAIDPLFFGDSGKSVDPENVGIVSIPKENLDNGALLVDFDLNRPAPYSLQEVRSYGDVPLKGATYTKAAVPAIMKYSDAEQRDERGRWTDGGGGPVMEPLRAEAAKYDSFDDFQSAYLAEIKHGLYWHVTKYSDSQPRVPVGDPAGGEWAGGMASSSAIFKDISRKFLGPYGPIAKIGHAPGNNWLHKNDIAWTDQPNQTALSEDGRYQSHISLNEDLLKLPVLDTERGWWPKGVPHTSAGAVVHEFGHAVENYVQALHLNTGGRVDADAWSAYQDARTAATHYPVSGYARSDPDEAFAEAFSAAYDPSSKATGMAAAKAMTTFMGYWPTLVDQWHGPSGRKADVLKYSEDEAREPAGGPGGGEWSGGDSGVVPWGADVRSRYPAAPVIAPKSQETVELTRSRLARQGRLNPDGTVTMYHITRDPDAILREGLSPSHGYSGQNVALYGDHAVYLYGNRADAESYFRVVQQSSIEGIPPARLLAVDLPVTSDVLSRIVPDEEVDLRPIQAIPSLVAGLAIAVLGGVPASAISLLKGQGFSGITKASPVIHPARKPATHPATSPLQFSAAARAALLAANRQAWQTGYNVAYPAASREDLSDEQWGDDADADAADAADRSGSNLDMLAPLLIGGGISAAMFDAWMGQYAAGANVLYEQGFGAGAAAQGMITSATWHKQDDEACSLCDERDGQVWYGDDEHPYPGEGYYGDVCLLPDTMVQAPRIAKLYRRPYDGITVRLTTRRSGELTVTPNHPVLTDHGWVAAEFLQPGDHVVSGRLDQDTTPAHPHVQERPARIEDVYRAFAEQGHAHRHPGHRVDFHGDGIPGEYVEVVATEDVLVVTQYAASLEPTDKLALSGPDGVPDGLSLLRHLLKARLGVVTAAPRGVLSSPYVPALLGRPTRVDKETSISGRSDNAKTVEPVIYGISPDAVSGSERVGGLAVQVAFDKIINVKVLPYAGHVYNLATATGWYLAGNYTPSAYRVLVSNCDGGPNCRCELIYDIVPADTADVSDDVAAAASGPDISKLSVPELLALRTVLKSVEDEARDARGRWTAGAGEDFSKDDVALRFDDIHRWTWASRDDLAEIRAGAGHPGTLGNRFLVNMVFADPTTETTYRGAFVPGTKEQIAAEYAVGKQIDLPLTSFSRQEQEAGAYLNGIMAHDYRDGLSNGTVNMVMFHLEPGAQVADIGATSITDAEVVTAGRFEVTSLAHEQTATIGYGSGHGADRQTYQQDGVTVIGLRQIGIIKP